MKYLEEETDWVALWPNQGGWFCPETGSLQHPLSTMCCHGHSRTGVIAALLFRIGSTVDKKLKNQLWEHHRWGLQAQFLLSAAFTSDQVEFEIAVRGLMEGKAERTVKDLDELYVSSGNLEEVIDS